MAVRWSNVSGRLNYILVYAPHFPEEDQTSFEKEFNLLRCEVDLLSKRVRGIDDERSFSMAKDALQGSYDAYIAGNEYLGSQLLQVAERHLKDGVKHKKVKITFIADAAGIVQKNDESS
jgi:hypothetical protein